MGIVYMIYYEKLAYVGSTVQPLYDRMYSHKSNHKNWQEGKYHYCTSFEIIQHEGYQVMVIEEVAEETDDDLRWRERFWIEWYGINNLVNKLNPIQSRKETLEQQKKYYYDNHDEINRKNREYYATNREKKKEYIADNRKEIKRKKREYYVANSEEIKLKQRERYAARKAKVINEKN